MMSMDYGDKNDKVVEMTPFTDRPALFHCPQTFSPINEEKLDQEPHLIRFLHLFCILQKYSYILSLWYLEMEL